MRARDDAPDEMLLAFRMTANRDVRWARAEELEVSPLRKQDRAKGRKLPFGKLAGSKVSVGHGRLVLYAGRQLLTMDIAAGLTWFVPQRRFAWNAGVAPESGDRSPEDQHYLDTIRLTWALDDKGRLVWRFSPHSTIPAGALALGVPLAGRGDNALTFRGRVYVSSDVIHALTYGALPWQDDSNYLTPVAEPVPHEWE